MRFIPLYILSILVLVSCSTKKNTLVRRNYHNLTSHYNTYFNGNEALKQGILKLEGTHKNNYTEIIAVFPLGTKKDQQSVIPDMDRSIEKASKVITKHSMEFKGIQYVKWIDDAYLMVGKANFYKGEYLSAYETFDFITKKFNKNPIRIDAYMWMARSLMEMGKMNKVSSFLGIVENEINSGKEVSTHVKKTFPMVKADYLIRTEEFKDATDYLEQAIKLNPRKKTRTRLMFVLAQVYQKMESNQKALNMYQAVLKKNPSYEIAFHCKIYSAQCFNSSQGSSASITKELDKMLKDSKNNDYRDEIYFALSNIAMKEGKEEKSIEYLKLSAQYSTTNTYQKTVTYLKLADLYFEKKNYQPAQTYYDTAVLVLPKDFPNADKIKDRHHILTNLVTNLLVVDKQDSLQKLANMSERDRNAAIDKLIQDYIKEEEERKKREREKLAATNNTAAQQNLANTNSNWYFYNASTVAFGKSEFRKRWGERQIEDLWRLTNKEMTMMDFTQEGSETIENTDSVEKITNPRDRNYYLKDIPITEEAKAQSNAKIETALYNIGRIYKDYLNEYNDAIAAHETLLSRFPKTKHEYDALILLHSSNQSAKNSTRAEYYKQLIINKFPNSDYTKLLLDPDFLKTISKQRGEASNAYEETYSDFLSMDYKTVIDKSNKAIASYKDPTILSQFEFIKAISLSKIYGKDTLKTLMKNIVKLYPETETKDRANDILAYFDNSKKNATSNDSNKNSLKQNLIQQQYKTPKSDDIHLFVMLLNTKDVSISKIKSIFSDFNSKYYKNDKLNVSNLYINDERIMISVSHFKTKDKSISYMNLVNENDEIANAVAKAESLSFTISAENYSTFYKSKDENKYFDFFKQNYLKNK